MDNNLLDSKRLSRAGIAGAGLGILGISLFVGLWMLLGDLEVDIVVRLVLSVCFPPIVIAGVVGIFAAMSRSKTRN